jgi:hypothetical protein
MKLYNKTPAFLLFFLLLTACGGNETHEGDDTPDVDEVPVEISEVIVGEWLIEKSTRSGKEVTTFGDLTISYSADGTFKSNLFDGMNKTPFEEGVKATIDGSNIYFDEVDVSYYVEDISDSLLILSTEIRDFPFEFTFKKMN